MGDASSAAAERMLADLEDLSSMLLEQKYRERAGHIFACILRRPRALSPDELDDLMEEGVAVGAFDEDAGFELLMTGLILKGRRRDSGGEAYATAEVGRRVTLDHVARAATRAATLGRMRPVLSAVAGQAISTDVAAAVTAAGVLQIVDGRIVERPETHPAG